MSTKGFRTRRFWVATLIVTAALWALAVTPNYTERVRIMRDEMGPWLYEYVPGVAIASAHAIAGVGPKVGEWALIPGHMGFHNWEYVARAR